MQSSYIEPHQNSISRNDSDQSDSGNAGPEVDKHTSELEYLTDVFHEHYLTVD